MQRLLITAFACLYSLSTYGQLSNGSIAPDFTVSDINENEWNLYTLLEEGKSVILSFSTTWCVYCWDYHNSGILELLFTEYGPNGSNDLMVFLLESDDNTNIDDLNGTGNSTIGNWTSSTSYPIIDNASNIFEEYENSYFPTIYTICPNKTLFQSGAISFDQHVLGAFVPCLNYINGCTDPNASNYDQDATEDDGSCEYTIGLYYDGNGDGCVDINDILNLLLEYGQCEPESQLEVDGNGDGCVNGEDVLNIIVEYGICE